ncbi:TKL protein kinase [Saprolegnia parasitica CBS 223.65]|uniref:TKL protein kinase n=1 Tax=Saprolegnia parasitica (strain CBS 223.65) TaxID=695850 RepID=A0A067BYD5_SAPPC|nr:TKL protein kinase [Saprolegnia parasitica CBS 223.65]KDO19582.1 TKL protein kinase [Saprolegnia parasitica CBS 223.65]|eukprot:XP_012209707.1 TKL protein kinase [Saprolegnia parasitica CBS 223.65]
MQEKEEESSSFSMTSKEKEEALRKAAEDGKLADVQSYLDNGVNVNCFHHGRTPLHDAARCGYLEIVRLLLEKGAAIDVKAINGGTPLHGAALHGQLEIVRFLLAKGAAIDVKSKNGETPLHYAAEEGELETVRLLLEKGAAIDVKTKKGKTPLMVAEREGHDNVIALLQDSLRNPGNMLFKALDEKRFADAARILAQETMDPNLSDRNGSSLVLLVLETQDLPLLQTLLKKPNLQIDINDETTRALVQNSCVVKTLFLQATSANDASIVDRLLSLGINPTLSNEKGETALQLAAASGHAAVVTTLLAKLLPASTATDDNNLSYKALTAARTELLAAQTHLLLRNTNRKTALDLASGDVLEQLLAGKQAIQTERTRLEHAMQSKKDALSTAISAHNWATATELLREGVPIQTELDQESIVAAVTGKNNEELLLALLSMAVENDNVSLLRSALQVSMFRHEMCQKVLVDAVARDKVHVVLDLLRSFPDAVQGTSDSGPSPLHIAAKSGSLALLGMLLASPSTDIDAINEDGDTALAMTVANNHVEATSLLVRAGANVSMLLPNGSSVLHAAVLSRATNSADMLQILLTSPSITIDQTDQEGYTALARAVLAQRADLVEQLVHAGADATLRFQDGQNLSIVAAAARRRDQGIAMCLNDHVYPEAARISKADVTPVEKPLGNGTGETLRGMVREAKAMREEIDNTEACRSPHVVAILAAVDYASTDPQMVLEFMDQGDVFQYHVNKGKGKHVEIEITPMQVAWSTANALDVIHSLGKVHRDVKSMNIFISSIHGVKLGDFGTARAVEPNMTIDAGTQRWTAPEVLRASSTGTDEVQAYGTAADIYSFGIVLSELATDNEPYDTLLDDRNLVQKIRDNGLRPDLGQDCPRWLRKLATACWAPEPSTRPTAKQIVKYLAKRLDEPEVDDAFDDDDDDLTPDPLDRPPTTPTGKLESINEEP